MPVRVPHVHLADVPRHVRRRESDVQPGGHALSMNLVNVLHPHRHPHSLSAVWSSSDANVDVFAPRPRPPCPPWQGKISHSPDPTAPKVGGFPQSHSFLQPHFSNHAKLAEMSDTFNIGVMPFASMARKDNTALKSPHRSNPSVEPVFNFEQTGPAVEF